MDARNHAVKSVVGRKESAASPDMAGPFADLLQRHRRAAKLSQEALAERAGLSRRGVSDLECGVRQTPRADTVARLADALGLSDSERLSFQVASGTLRASSPHEANALVRAAQSSKDQTPVLVGRTLEIALLDRHLGHEGAPLLLLAGEPGIGKSRLLREAGERALAAGWRVLRGGCQRRSVQAPYEPIVDALARYITSRSTGQLRSDLKGAHWLVRLLPELAERTVAPRPQWHLPPAQERRLMFAAVGRFLENVAGARGTLLVLDDLQWAGVDALELLDAVLRQETDAQEADATVPPLRVVGAYRETEVRLLDPLARFLTDTVGEGIALRRQLGPLRDEDARALLSALLRGEEDGDAALCERIVHRSGGVPLFLVSCARGLRSGALSGEGGTEEEIPWDLRQNIRQRVTALPEPAQRLLGVAAIAGREASLGLLESASGQGEEELLAALEAADHARLLVATDSQTYRFVHDVIREVVEADLGRARRQLLHRKVAEALEQRGEHELEQLAYHYEQAGENAKALVYLERVGDRAIERYAAAEAEHIYRLIATLAAAIADRRAQARALEKLGEILQTGGRYADAQAAFETAEHLYRVAGDRERYANLSARIAWVEADQGNHQAAVTRLEHALQEETTLAPAERSALYLTLAQLYATRGEFGSEAALAASERATQLALIANDEQGLVRANARRGALLVETAGRRVEGVAVLREVATHAEAIGDRWSLQRAFTGLGEWHRHAGLFTLAHHFHTLAVETAEARGDPLDMSFALFLRGDVEYYRGDWRAARTDWEYAVALTRDLLPSWRTPYPVAALASLDLYEGKPELAMRQFARSVELAANGNDVQFMRYVAWFESERDLLERRPEAARSRLEQLLDRPGERSEQVTDLLHLLAWAHLELGDLSRAEATLAAGLARAHADESRVVIASLQRVQGMLLARRGRLEDAGETLERTIARCREMPFPHEALRSHHVYGQLLASKGETQGARAQYEAALTICDQLGERLYAEHVERAIAALPASSESLP